MQRVCFDLNNPLDVVNRKGARLNKDDDIAKVLVRYVLDAYARIVLNALHEDIVSDEMTPPSRVPLDDDLAGASI